MKKKHSLKNIYYISFSLLVVVPVLLVFVTAISVIRMMVFNSAVSAITNAQSAVSASLKESVRDASLQLSHFVYVNNNELMQLAAMTDTQDSGERYYYTAKLDELFQVAMAPKQTVVSGMIYMKDGSHTYLKKEAVIPKEEIKKTSWYQEAAKNKNRVTVGCYDPVKVKITSTAIKQQEMVITVALAPDNVTDRSEKIDIVALFINARIGSMMREFARQPGLGPMAVVDSRGNLLFGSDADGQLAASLLQLPSLAQGEYRLKLQPEGTAAVTSYIAVLTDVPGTEWKIYSCVRSSALTGEFNRIALLLLAVIIALFALYIVFSGIFLRTIIKPIHTMVGGLHEIEAGNLETHIEPEGLYEIRTMIHSFNRMARQLRTSVRENEIAQQTKLEAEIRALQSQINPHFLVNTLNSIRFMAQVSKFDGIRKMAEALIRILSCSFRSKQSFYTVDEELEMLDSYLYLMKIRYSDGFEVEYQIQDECRQYQIPRLTLQPIVENSIVHGFINLEEEMGRLTIRIRAESGHLRLEVEDNGIGLTLPEIEALLAEQTEASDNYSIGISNVYSRLKLNFGDDCSLAIESEPGKFCRTVVCVPILAEGSVHNQGGSMRRKIR